MTQRIGDAVIISGEEDRRCELCGEIEECRPAGPKGEQVCFDCAQKDQQALKRYADRLFNGGEVQ